MSDSAGAVRVVIAISVLWLAALAYSAATGRVLYGDGALYVLIHLMNPHRFNDYDFQRTFASIISQSPVLLGQRLGLHSVRAYAALYELGMHVVPAAAMIAALVIARKQRVIFAALVLAAVVYGFGTDFINTEANIFFGLVWLSVAIMANRGLNPVLRALAMPACAIALIRCYEGMLLVGPILAAWAVVEMKAATAPEERSALLLSALLFFLGATIGLGGYLAPRDPGNAASFASSSLRYFRAPHLLLLLSAISAGVAVLFPDLRARVVFSSAAAILGASFVVGIFRLDGYYAFDVYYHNRAFLVLLLPVLIAALLYVVSRRPAWIDMRLAGHASWHILLIPFLFAVMGDIVGTYRWQTYVGVFCGTLKADLSPQERIARLVHSGVRTGWPWTHPTLSVLLRGRQGDAIVANEPGAFQWEPFDPAKAPAIQYDGLCHEDR